LLEGAGLNLTILSNMGNVDFGVIACRELVPDVWDIADGFADAVQLLLKRAQEAQSAPANGTAKKPRPRKKAAPPPDESTA
jgi:hypothetical protein